LKKKSSSLGTVKRPYPKVNWLKQRRGFRGPNTSSDMAFQGGGEKKRHFILSFDLGCRKMEKESVFWGEKKGSALSYLGKKKGYRPAQQRNLSGMGGRPQEFSKRKKKNAGRLSFIKKKGGPANISWLRKTAMEDKGKY